MTAHHIIPESLLKKVYGLLNEEHRREIDESSGASRVDPDRRLGEEERKNEKLKYISWPQGNVFYGPNTSIRTEAGDKDDFDYDARFLWERKVFWRQKNAMM